MPVYEIAGPDGKIYSIEGPEGATREEVIRAIQARMARPSGKEQAGFVESFKESAGTLKAAPAATRFATADTPEEQEQARRELLAATESQYGRTSFEDVKDFSSAVDWAKQTVGGSLGYLVAPGAAALFNPLAGVGVLGSQYTTSNLVRQAEEQERAAQEGRAVEDTSVGKAVAGAAGQTALDVLGFKLLKPLFKSFPLMGKILGEEGAEGVKEGTDLLRMAIEKGNLGYKGGIAVGVAAGTTFEIPQEIAQQAIERWQAGLSLGDEEAQREYKEAAAGAVLVGAGLGGVGGALDVRRSRIEKEEAVADAEASRIETQAKAEEEARAAEEAAAQAQREAARAEKEQKREEKRQQREKLLATIGDQMTAAVEILKPLGPEQKVGDYINKLTESGMPYAEAQRVLSGLKREQIVVKGEKEGTFTLVEPITPPSFEAEKAAAAQQEAEGAAEFVPIGTPDTTTPATTTPATTTPAASTTTPPDLEVDAEINAQREAERLAQEEAARAAQAGTTPPTTEVKEATKSSVATSEDMAKAGNDILDLEDQGRGINLFRARQVAKGLGVQLPNNAKKVETIDALRQVLNRPVKAKEEATSTPPTTETTSEPVSTSAEQVVSGAVAGSPDLSVQRDATEGLGAAESTVGGVGSTESTAERTDEREGRSEPALTPEEWRERVESSRAKENSPKTLLERINNLKREFFKYEKTPLTSQQFNYTSQIEAVLSALRKAKTPEEFLEQARLPAEEVESILGELKDEGIVNEDNTINEAAFKEDAQNRSVYNRFMRSVETPMLSLARGTDYLIDKYSEAELTNSDKVRKNLANELAKLEDLLATYKEREAAAREAAKKDRAEVGVERGEAYTRAQAEAKMGETITPSVEGDTVEQSSELADAVLSMNVDKILSALRNIVAENILTATSLNVPSEQLFEPRLRKLRNQLTFSLIERLQDIDFRKLKIQIEGAEGANQFIFNRLRSQGRLAEYDPKTNTVYFRKGLITPKIVLHEFVHAATVKVLQGYLNPTTRTNLTGAQREATEHILKIYEFSKKRLSKAMHKDALENVFEFVGYALTDPKLQRDLVRIQKHSLTKYTTLKSAITNVWKEFTSALADLFGLRELAIAGKQRVLPKTVLATKTRNKVSITEKSRKTRSETGDKPLKFDTEAVEDVDPETGEVLTEEQSNLQYVDEYGNIAGSPSRLGSAAPGYKGNLMLEVSEAIDAIFAAPEPVEGVEPLAARRRNPNRRVVSPTPEDFKANQVAKVRKYKKPTILGNLFKMVRGEQFYDKLARHFQDTRRALRNLQKKLEMAGRLIIGGPDANNAMDLIDLSGAKSFHNMMQYFETPRNRVFKAAGEYAKALGVDIEKAMGDLAAYLIARHEPERRHVKYLTNVPLNNEKKFRSKTLKRVDTAAGHRDYILSQLYNNLKDAREALGRELTADERKNLIKGYREVLEALVDPNNGFLDQNGKSTVDAKPGTMPLDEAAPEYNVIGTIDRQTIATLQAEFDAQMKEGAPTAAPLREILSALEEIKENTKMLDRKANYWSQQTDNLVDFYNYQNYVPFKGKYEKESMVSAGDERFELSGYTSSDNLEFSQRTMGRETDSDNPVFQILVDGVKSSMRAGRIGVSQALKNLIEKKYIDGKRVAQIKFEDRFKPDLNIQRVRGDNRFFHYKDDGTIDVYLIKDRLISNSVRRQYQAVNPYLEGLNTLTSFVGHLHTRYNPAFYPLNFVRDTLTNAYVMGSDIGAKEGVDYVSEVAKQVSKLGLIKMGKISKLYVEGNAARLAELAQNDPDVALALEFFEQGGRVAYIQGLALQGQMDAFLTEIGENKGSATVKQLNKWVDIWADAFEFTSRVAAYKVAKSRALADGLSEEAARQKAAAFSKNLANFEQVGEYGKAAGALFMFFRPAATGAVRAIDSLRPIFQNADALIADLPDNIKTDPVAVTAFKRNHAKQAERAKYMLYALMGAGATLYLMAYMAADEDDLGRNKVATDDMALWTRNLRLPLSFMGSDNFLQIPWGFGLGSFAAAGSQIMGVAIGKEPPADMFVNLMNVGLDSFVPIPFSRISPIENFPAFLADSISPSVVRPFIQFAMNTDGLGREIFNNRQTKYGEAFTGGKNVPDMYKDAAGLLFDITNADVKVQPNTLYFWANNYADGFARVAANLYGLGLTAGGGKDFDPKVDFALISSFIGRKNNIDAREFASVEKKILQKADSLRALENRAKVDGDYSAYYRYVERNPYDPTIVYIYNRQTNGYLRDLRSYRNTMMSDRRLTPRERKAQIEMIDANQNLIKRHLMGMFEQYGVKPN